MIEIYIIENKLNGKIYIGQSVQVQRRLRDHKKTMGNPNSRGYEYPLYRSTRKYGIENFAFSLLEECSKEELDEREIFWIKFYDSSNSEYGYNQTAGGNGGGAYVKLNTEKIAEITEYLKEGVLNNVKIADKYNISEEMVRLINTGESWYREEISYPIREPIVIKKTIHTCIECGDVVTKKGVRCVKCSQLSRRVAERPSKEELLKLVATEGFTKVGKKHGVSVNTIKKWMIAYNLPHLIKEIRELYGNTPPPKIKQKTKRYLNIKIEKDSELYFFTNTSEAADWFLSEGITSAQKNSVIRGITKALSGDATSYFGYLISGDLIIE